MSAVVDHVVHEDEIEPVRDDGDTAAIRVSFDSSNGYAGVQIMNVSAGWYHDHFMWGRRIVTEPAPAAA